MLLRNVGLAGLAIVGAVAFAASCGGGRSPIRAPAALDGGSGIDAAMFPDAGTPSCVDKKKNGLESDVDCGGSGCPKCADGKACNVGNDCASAMCNNKVCQPVGMATCFDSVQNAQETDVDCGGPDCPGCADGMSCQMGSDCANGVCTQGVCGQAAPNCNDGQQNGLETDVDCGGGTCPACANGMGCAANRDCKSVVCSAGVCVPGGGGGGFTCQDGIDCANQCMNQQCITTCQNKINTARGKNRFIALLACLENECPSSNGGVCDAQDPFYNDLDCSDCYTFAQDVNGACNGALTTCQTDM